MPVTVEIPDDLIEKLSELFPGLNNKNAASTVIIVLSQLVRRWKEDPRIPQFTKTTIEKAVKP